MINPPGGPRSCTSTASRSLLYGIYSRSSSHRAKRELREWAPSRTVVTGSTGHYPRYFEKLFINLLKITSHKLPKFSQPLDVEDERLAGTISWSKRHSDGVRCRLNWCLVFKCSRLKHNWCLTRPLFFPKNKPWLTKITWWYEAWTIKYKPYETTRMCFGM